MRIEGLVAVLVLATTGVAAKGPEVAPAAEARPDPHAHGEKAETLPVAGVVVAVDRKAGTLMIVAPVGDHEIVQFSRSVYVDRDTNLVSIRARVEAGAVILRNGAVARLADLSEGDVVRTSFDPATRTFESLTAVSPQRIDRNLDEAQKELKRDLSAPPGGARSDGPEP